MTIQVTVTNEDKIREVKIAQRDIKLDGDSKPTGEVVPAEVLTLAPEEKRTVWIHSGRDIIVSEGGIAAVVPTPDADAPAKP